MSPLPLELWERGEDSTFLLRLRETGDYGGGRHVTHDEALQAITAAATMIDTVRCSQTQFD